MATVTQQKVFEHAKLALGSGNLTDVTDGTLETTNNAKQVHTILRSGAGTVKGSEESTLRFTNVISEDGEEVDWLGLAKTHQHKLYRFKTSGRTMSFVGQVQSANYSFGTDDADKVEVVVIGRVDD